MVNLSANTVMVVIGEPQTMSPNTDSVTRISQNDRNHNSTSSSPVLTNQNSELSHKHSRQFVAASNGQALISTTDGDPTIFEQDTDNECRPGNGLDHHSADCIDGDNNEVDEQDNACLLCNAVFNLLLHKRFVCKVCALNVCRNCALFDDPDWICTVCDQQRTISNQVNCQSWICKRIKANDKDLIHLVNAKLKLEEKNGTNFGGIENVTSVEDLIAIRSDVELIVVKLLGIDTIDYAHVGILFDDTQYSELVESYSEILAELLSVLQESILISQSGKEPNLSPTEAYSRLKELLSHISEKSFEFSLLRPNQLRPQDLTEFILNCRSYEHLLSNSIVNQIVEVSQIRFMTTPSFKSGTLSSISGHFNSLSPHNFTSRVRSSCSGSFYASNESESECCNMPKLGEDFNSLDSNSERAICSPDDENNEITKLNQSDYEENYEDEEEEDDDNEEGEEDDVALNFDQVKVFFPEAGVDLVDCKKYPSVDSDLSQDSGIKLIDNSNSWQDNWYFKKNKDNRSYHQYHLNSDIHYGYMALALSEPVPMLIPNPSHSILPLVGDLEADQISDLSEHNSETSSIIFSDEDENETLDELIIEQADENDNSGQNINAKYSSQVVYLQNNNPKLVVNGDTTIDCVTKTLVNKISKPNFSFSQRWSKIKVPDFVPSELRTICSSMPNPYTANLEYVPSFSLKPGNAQIHSGIIAQFCCKAKGLMPLYFAWYKDGQLIAASDDSRTMKIYEDNRLCRSYFGIRFIHRRYVESPCSLYRLIVFNDNECILELKKSCQSHSGIYSVVAYNHFGYDWCDFRLTVDREHFSASSNMFSKQQSPRPVRRRPQNKQRKNVDPSKQSSNYAKCLEKDRLKAVPNVKSSLDVKINEFYPNVIQRTWQEREAESQNNNDAVNNSVSENTTSLDFGKQILPTSSSPQFVTIPQGQDTNPFTNQCDESLLSNELFEEHLDENQQENSNEFNGPIKIITNIVHSKRFDGKNIVGKYEEKIDIVDLTTQDESMPVMPIADREHRKWLTPDVELVNNPYSAENIEQRTRQMNSVNSFHDEDETCESLEKDDSTDDTKEDEIENKKFFSSDRDINRYKRDYYLPANREKYQDSQVFSVLDTLGGKQQRPQSNSTPCESLSSQNEPDNKITNGHNSHVEIVESSTDKVEKENTFTIQNPTALESSKIEEAAKPNNETKHISTVKKIVNADLICDNLEPSKHNDTNLTPARPLKDQEIAKLPSVKNLVNLFSSSSSPANPSVGNEKSTEKTNGSKSNNWQSSNGNSFKVHSITSRSMPREFREMKNKNLPKPTNRISLSNEMLGNSSSKQVTVMDAFSETDSNLNSLNNGESITVIENGVSNTNGTARSAESLTGLTDESSCKVFSQVDSSSSSLPANSSGKPINFNTERYRPILKRASYWEKRMEEGLISDYKVEETFPTMDGSKA